MSGLDSLYLILTFLLSTSTIIFSIMLFTLRIPQGQELKRYNISRYILASAYMVIGLFNCSRLIKSSADVDLGWVQTSTLFSASFQALLFTFTLLVLIRPLYVTFKKVIIQFIIILLFFLCSIVLIENVPRQEYRYYFNVISVLYVFQLIYYVFLFERKYAEAVKQLGDYYNEDEDNRLRWVKIAFYLALSIGVIALGCSHMPLSFSIYFIIVINAFYIFFAIKYCNYPSQFGYIIAAVSSEQIKDDETECFESETTHDGAGLAWSRKELELQKALDKWVENKKFRHDDMSRDDIVESLGTDRNFLAYFFHHRMQIEFRVWRTQLRIEEAKKLLLEYPGLSVSKIAQKVGISDRSNFQKKFMESTGMSPKDWRKLNLPQ